MFRTIISELIKILLVSLRFKNYLKVFPSPENNCNMIMVILHSFVGWD